MLDGPDEYLGRADINAVVSPARARWQRGSVRSYELRVSSVFQLDDASARVRSVERGSLTAKCEWLHRGPSRTRARSSTSGAVTTADRIVVARFHHAPGGAVDTGYLWPCSERQAKGSSTSERRDRRVSCTTDCYDPPAVWSAMRFTRTGPAACGLKRSPRSIQSRSTTIDGPVSHVRRTTATCPVDRRFRA